MARGLLRFLGLALAMASGCAAEVELDVALTDSNRVEASLRREGQLEVGSILLYRSTSPLDGDIDTLGLPVTVLRFPAGNPDAVLVDSMFADNVTYYYRARVRGKPGEDLWSNVDSVSVPDRELGRITGSSLLVDKLNYFLEVRDGGRACKRYPVALGRRPRNRKLVMDRASTPEGIYRIANEQPQATFHKAFDIDYPNEVDRARWNLHRELGLLPAEGGDPAPIGGEIQIHGEGIGSNWTLGCIALRNPDIDELFAHDRVGKGMPVFIVGSELGRRDISSIRDYRTGGELRRIQRRLRDLGLYDREPDGVIGSGTRRALGRFQRENGLPVTCDFDARTVRLLRAE
jgi:lipoprotein-anchoring transpeptidase ErfK/SrfK